MLVFDNSCLIFFHTDLLSRSIFSSPFFSNSAGKRTELCEAVEAGSGDGGSWRRPHYARARHRVLPPLHRTVARPRQAGRIQESQEGLCFRLKVQVDSFKNELGSWSLFKNSISTGWVLARLKITFYSFLIFKPNFEM